MLHSEPGSPVTLLRWGQGRSVWKGPREAWVLGPSAAWHVSGPAVLCWSRAALGASWRGHRGTTAGTSSRLEVLVAGWLGGGGSQGWARRWWV